MNMSLANAHAAVIEHLITFSDRFFPGEVTFIYNAFDINNLTLPFLLG